MGNFYPRSPCGERQPGEHHANSQQEFLSTLSLRRATFLCTGAACKRRAISIHALLAESDAINPEHYTKLRISIHALLAESDSYGIEKLIYEMIFLSTLSLRRATAIFGVRGSAICNFYPRSPCGERPVQIVIIVVHTLFLSTLSLRRATHHGRVNLFRFEHFYPRSPCGERLSFNIFLYHTAKFLSTLSLRRATV